MDKERVIELAQLMPDVNSVGHLADAQSRKLAYWLNEPAMGKLLANHFAARSEDLPLSIHEEWIQRAYMHACGMVDPVIMECDALFLSGKTTVVTAIKAGLLAKDGGSIFLVARQLGLPVSLIECFEQLYFNVLDRKDEVSYISTLVYPNGRMDEMDSDYYHANNTDKIAMRAAYNTSYEYALYILGMTQVPAVMDAAKMFEASIMREGAVAIATGGIHSDNKAITHAKGLLAAAKQGGNDSSAETDEMGPSTVGGAIVESLMKHQSIIYPQDKPTVIDVDIQPVNSKVKANT